jgi:ferric-dicitrate binding protein FerR (iron transport regulator)
MGTIPGSESIIKTDVLGRIKTPAARREQLLDEFERSGLSGCKFAELVGIKYSTFATWGQKRRRARGTYAALKTPAKAAEQVRWLEAVVQEAQDSKTGLKESIVLELRGGGRVELSHAKQLPLAAALLRELESRCGKPSC